MIVDAIEIRPVPDRLRGELGGHKTFVEALLVSILLDRGLPLNYRRATPA
jgi:hypothetical protein